MVVRTPTPIEGAWYWTSDSEAIYRPKKYWPVLMVNSVLMAFISMEVMHFFI